MFIFNADIGLESLGYTKIYENKGHVVQYIRPEHKYKYVKCIDILHKSNGVHLIQCYQKGVNSDGFNNSCGITEQEAKLCLRKLRSMGWRRWFKSRIGLTENQKKLMSTAYGVLLKEDK